MNATTDRDDDFGALDLDDMPGIPPLVRNARVAADLLFVDPPPATRVTAEPNRIIMAGPENVAMLAWIDRRLELHEATAGVDGVRSWHGVIEGVPVRVVDLGGAR